MGNEFRLNIEVLSDAASTAYNMARRQPIKAIVLLSNDEYELPTRHGETGKIEIEAKVVANFDVIIESIGPASKRITSDNPALRIEFTTAGEMPEGMNPGTYSLVYEPECDKYDSIVSHTSHTPLPVGIGMPSDEVIYEAILEIRHKEEDL